MRAEDWISVAQRVPDDRRLVAVWIDVRLAPRFLPGSGCSLHTSSFNPSPRGGRFDIEAPQRFRVVRVTHWQEIEAPAEAPVKPPPKQP
jgi:hypothetical protein